MSEAEILKARLDQIEREGVVDYELAGRLAYLDDKDLVWDAPDHDYLGGDPRAQWQTGWMARHEARWAALTQTKAA